MPRTVLVLILSALTLSCTSSAVSAEMPPAKPKSIILLIADGAGSAHFTVARMIRGASFNAGRMPVTGIVSTSPVDGSRVTDSAAAATAYATGVRTRYRAVSVDAAGKAHRTLLELAEQQGKATGLVTTANFYDATPAAFAAHSPSRYESDLIIRQMLGSGVEVIIGGGLAHFGTEGRPPVEDIATAAGYSTARSLAELRADRSAHLLGIFPTQKMELDFPEARLPDLAGVALDRVSTDPDGFFLLIEHEGTDGASHRNATEALIDSLHSFDEAVGIALDYAAAHRDVLVVVTGDHETGGLQIHAENAPELRLKWATEAHTGEAIPLFASGPGAQNLSGFIDGDELGRRLQALWK